MIFLSLPPQTVSGLCGICCLTGSAPGFKSPLAQQRGTKGTNRLLNPEIAGEIAQKCNGLNLPSLQLRLRSLGSVFWPLL